MLNRPFLWVALALSTVLSAPCSPGFAQAGDGYAPPWQKDGRSGGGDAPRPITPRRDENRSPPASGPSGGADHYAERRDSHNSDAAPPPYRSGEGRYDGPAGEEHETFSSDEIVDAGRSFFGSVTKGLADVVEYAFSRQGRPNGYILGEEGGGAYFAGLRYGEGRLHTKHMGVHKVFWQGPSLGLDVGGDGSKTMVLVYNLRYPEQMFDRFGGVDGSAYVVGGVGITFLTRGDMVLAPIRSGVGLRLGANIGYLKYTPYPTWNPF